MQNYIILTSLTVLLYIYIKNIRIFMRQVLVFEVKNMVI